MITLLISFISFNLTEIKLICEILNHSTFYNDHDRNLNILTFGCNKIKSNIFRCKVILFKVDSHIWKLSNVLTWNWFLIIKI